MVELKGKEASLMAKKRHLEQRIVDLDVSNSNSAAWVLLVLELSFIMISAALQQLACDISQSFSL